MTTDRQHLVARGRRLEYLTVAWNTLEAAVAIASGVLAGSIALLGFGLDSVIETFSGVTLLWRLHLDRDPQQRERAEQKALRLVGISFLLLTLYVVVDAIKTLVKQERPAESIPGIVLAVAALMVMPLLARAKRRVAAAIGSGALHADSRQTDICAYLSAILVAGLLLNALLGWWWADPAAALIMSPIIAREGVEALRGKSCACSGHQSQVANGR
jgi:divalent metal cation (Fe/Co/Zn/Cd) transporter